VRVNDALMLQMVSAPAGATVRDGTDFMRWLGIGALRACEGEWVPARFPGRDVAVHATDTDAIPSARP